MWVLRNKPGFSEKAVNTLNPLSTLQPPREHISLMRSKDQRELSFHTYPRLQWGCVTGAHSLASLCSHICIQGRIVVWQTDI